MNQKDFAYIMVIILIAIMVLFCAIKILETLG
jgi:hypothetical protein